LIISALRNHIKQYFKAKLPAEKSRDVKFYMNFNEYLRASIKSALRNAQGRHPAIGTYLSE